MPKKTSKSSLASKLGNAGRTAFEEGKSNTTTYTGGSDLPAGIEGGIAELVDCKFGEFQTGHNQGEPFFYAAGIVVSPKVHNGIPITGLRTQIGPEPICDTPKSFGKKKTMEDHLNWVLNELRKLGIDTSDIELDDLDEVVAALKKIGPRFRFRTWQGEANERFPNPRVQHDWRGMCETVEETEEDGGVDDQTEELPPHGDPPPDDEVPFNDIASDADGGDAEAIKKLTKFALENGVTQDQIDEAENWEDVAALAQKEEEEEEESEEESESTDVENWEPKKEEVYKYKPPRARKLVECEVTAVFAGKQTVNLKNLADHKIYKSINWDALVD